MTTTEHTTNPPRASATDAVTESAEVAQAIAELLAPHMHRHEAESLAREILDERGDYDPGPDIEAMVVRYIGGVEGTTDAELRVEAFNRWDELNKQRHARQGAALAAIERELVECADPDREDLERLGYLEWQLVLLVRKARLLRDPEWFSQATRDRLDRLEERGAGR